MGCRVGELVTLIRGNTYKSSLLSDNGPVLLGLGSIASDGGFKDRGLKHYPGPSDQKILLHPGDLYVSLKDLTQGCSLLGAVSRVPESISEGRLTQDTVKLEFAEGVDTRTRQYVYWSLRTPQYREYCRAHGTGTTNMALSRADFLNWKIAEFTPYNNKLIVLFENIDDKIALNARMNGCLEELLDGLFQSEILNASHDGWAAAHLTDIANYRNGLAMQRFRPPEGDVGLPVLKIRELRQGFCAEDAERCSSDIPDDVKIHDGDLVFSWSGSLLLDFWAGGDAGLNQHLFKVTSDVYEPWFYYVWTKHHMARFIAIAADRATTMGHIKRSALEEAEVAIPPAAKLDELSAIFKPIVTAKVNNMVESKKLAALRDALLPKLVSGEIDVSGVELD